MTRTLKTLFLHLLLIALASTILFLAIHFLLKWYTRYGVAIPVPPLTGRTLNQAQQQIEALHLKLVIIDSLYVDSLIHQPPRILEQNPAPPDSVKPGRPIYVRISRMHPPSIPLPEILDMPLRIARLRLKHQGFTIAHLQFQPYHSDSIVLAVLWKGKKIPPQTPIPSGSALTLVVGVRTGAVVRIPSYKGYSLAQAIHTIQSDSLEPGLILHAHHMNELTIHDSTKWFVHKQFPEPGRWVEPGTPIDLYVDSFPPSDTLPSPDTISGF